MFLFQKGKMQLKECLVTEPLVHRLQQSSVWWVIGGAALLRSRSSLRELYQMVNNLPFWELRLQLEALSTWSKLNWHRCSEAVVPLFYDALWVPKVILRKESFEVSDACWNIFWSRAIAKIYQVCSFTGQYGVPEGMVFSFPVIVDNSGRYRIVENMEISDEIKEKIQGMIKVNICMIGKL